MQYGISSSALFGRMETDQALAFLRDPANATALRYSSSVRTKYSGQLPLLGF